jgi:hypothetical protein
VNVSPRRSPYVALAAAHYLCTVLGLFIAVAWGQGVADGGYLVAPASLQIYLGVVIAFCLPLVYPLLAAEVLLPWTDKGALMLLIVGAMNSAVVALFVRAVVSMVRQVRLKRRERDGKPEGARQRTRDV